MSDCYFKLCSLDLVIKDCRKLGLLASREPLFETDHCYRVIVATGLLHTLLTKVLQARPLGKLKAINAHCASSLK